MTPMVALSGLSRSFGDNMVIPPLDLTVARGETLAVMGASGVGKTTLLRCIAGLDRGYQGEIQINGQKAKEYWRSNRAAMMFQHYTNFHWMTVHQNLAEAGRRSAIRGPVTDTEIDDILAAVGLKDRGNRYIASLSGGMQQRVALARVLLQDSDIVMLDEPFGALDVATRANLQDFTRREFHNLDKTVLFVTHDPVEALYVSDRVLTIRADGRHSIILSPVEEVIDQSTKLEQNFVAAHAALVASMMI